MKVIKSIAQIIGTVIYTSIFVVIMTMLAIVPIGWILSLPWWAMLLILFVGGSVILTIVSFIHTLIVAPYYWIIRKNKIAYVLTKLILIVSAIWNIILIWEFNEGPRNWLVVVKIVMTVTLLFMVGASIYGVNTAYYSDDKEYEQDINE